MRQTGERGGNELAADAFGALEKCYRDVAVTSQLLGGGEPGNAGTDDCDRSRAHVGQRIAEAVWKVLSTVSTSSNR